MTKRAQKAHILHPHRNAVLCGHLPQEGFAPAIPLDMAHDLLHHDRICGRCRNAYVRRGYATRAQKPKQEALT